PAGLARKPELVQDGQADPLVRGPEATRPDHGRDPLGREIELADLGRLERRRREDIVRQVEPRPFCIGVEERLEPRVEEDVRGARPQRPMAIVTERPAASSSSASWTPDWPLPTSRTPPGGRASAFR